MNEIYDINPKYTHFAVLKSTGKIINGWDYNGIDSEELKSDKQHYFISDIIDLDFKANEVVIYTKKYLLGKNINPFDTNNWY